MTNVNNINIQQISAGNNLLKSQGIGLDQTGLAGFISMLLGQVGQTQMTQQILPGSAELQQIAEKLSAALNLDPAKSDQLGQMIQEIAATSPATGIQPTLTSDLSAALAADVQTNFAAEVDNADPEQLAALLNGIEPGAEAQQSAIDPEIVEKLLTSFPQLADGTLSPEDLAALREKIAQFLQQQGVAQKDIKTYLAAFAANDAAATTANELVLSDEQADGFSSPPSMPVNMPSSLPLATEQQALPLSPKAAVKPAQSAQPLDTLTGSAKEAGARGSFTAPEAPAPEKNAEPKEAAVEKQPRTGRADIPAAPAQPATNNTTQPAAKLSSQTASLAIINSLANGDFGFDDSGNFSQQSFSQGADTAGIGSTGYLKTNEAGGSSFVNYMSAGRGLSGHTVQMIALQIQKNVAAKIDTFTMQLDPADLGRMDVKMSFDKEGGVKTHLSVDRPETLSMLQRDAHQIEKILQDAGLDTGGDLTFDLRQQNEQRDLQEFYGSRHGSRDNGNGTDVAANNAIQARIAVEAAGYISQSGVNIMV